MVLSNLLFPNGIKITELYKTGIRAALSNIVRTLSVFDDLLTLCYSLEVSDRDVNGVARDAVFNRIIKLGNSTGIIR